MNKALHVFMLAATLLPSSPFCVAQTPSKPAETTPADEYVYARPGGQELKLYVFQSAGGDSRKPRGAIVFFHGGGWSQGTAAWNFGNARYFAALWMAGISVDYRLADGNEVTPVESVADAKAAIGWVRSHAQALNIDPKRIAAYGESAGGLLVAAAAISSEGASKEEKESIPDAVLLYSPALDVVKYEGFQKMLKPGQDVSAILPDQHVRKGMPPTIIVTGELDEMPAAAWLAEYCKKVKQAHNRCELHIYPGVGHMLRMPGENENPGRTASKTESDAYLKINLFLKSLGYLPPESKGN